MLLWCHPSVRKPRQPQCRGFRTLGWHHRSSMFLLSPVTSIARWWVHFHFLCMSCPFKYTDCFNVQCISWSHLYMQEQQVQTFRPIKVSCGHETLIQAVMTNGYSKHWHLQLWRRHTHTHTHARAHTHTHDSWYLHMDQSQAAYQCGCGPSANVISHAMKSTEDWEDCMCAHTGLELVPVVLRLPEEQEVEEEVEEEEEVEVEEEVATAGHEPDFLSGFSTARHHRRTELHDAAFKNPLHRSSGVNGAVKQNMHGTLTHTHTHTHTITRTHASPLAHARRHKYARKTRGA